MAETPLHYRAEVKIDNDWMSFDNYRSENEQANQYTFVVTDWQKGNQDEIFNDYVQRIKNGEDLRGDETVWQTYNGFLEGRLIKIEMGELEAYFGISDDLGQEKRATNIDELLQGYGLIPYLSSKEKVLEFMGSPDWLLAEIDDFMQMKEDIENNMNINFYIIADIILSSKEDELIYAVYSEQYLGYTGESISEKIFNDYIK